MQFRDLSVINSCDFKNREKERAPSSIRHPSIGRNWQTVPLSTKIMQL